MLPLGQERSSFFGTREGERIRMGEMPVIATSSPLHDYMKSDIVAVVGSVIDGSGGANFQSSLNLGRVVDQELKRYQVLALLYVDGKGSISDG